MATTRKLTPAQARKAALESDFAPIYAVAGLTDAVATSLHATIVSTQEKASQRVADLQGKSESQAKATAEELTRFLKSLPTQVKGLPESTRTKLAELQKQTQELLAELNDTYGDLAGRGKKVVDDTLVNARTLRGKAGERAEDLAEDAAQAVDPVLADLQESVTQVRKTVSGKTATETVTPKSSTKVTATRAAKKASATPSTATSAPRTTATTKAPGTKAPATKTAATKTAAKKAPASKTPASKTPASKTAASKTAAKKTPASKTPAKKAPAKKAPASTSAAETTSAPTADATA